MPPTTSLTQAQAQQLAQHFHDVASAIGSARIRHATQLSDTQQWNLQNQQAQCTGYSNHFLAMSEFAQEADLAGVLSSIAASTESADHAIATIDNVDHILNIAAAAALLGASIVSMSPTSIAASTESLVHAVHDAGAALAVPLRKVHVRI